MNGTAPAPSMQTLQTDEAISKAIFIDNRISNMAAASNASGMGEISGNMFSYSRKLQSSGARAVLFGSGAMLGASGLAGNRERKARGFNSNRGNRF